MSKLAVEIADTKGRAALVKACEARGWRQADLARVLGMKDTGLVNRWWHGERVPGRKWSGVLEQTLGVKTTLWDEPIKSRPLPRTG